jgi:hypothetical protein
MFGLPTALIKIIRVEEKAYAHTRYRGMLLRSIVIEKTRGAQATYALSIHGFLSV